MSLRRDAWAKIALQLIHVLLKYLYQPMKVSGHVFVVRNIEFAYMFMIVRARVAQ